MKKLIILSTISLFFIGCGVNPKECLVTVQNRYDEVYQIDDWRFIVQENNKIFLVNTGDLFTTEISNEKRILKGYKIIKMED